MAEFLALLAAGCFALGTVLQQKGALETPAGYGDARFLVQILRRPAWLAGACCQGVGWILQAAALNTGRLDVVQSITALSLVMALPLGARLTDQTIERRQVIAAIQTTGGIVVFLVAGSPQAGSASPTAAAWWLSAIAGAAAVATLGTLGWSRSGSVGAALLGAAAGIAFAFQGAVTKEFVGQLGGGWSDVLAGWSPYALIATALIGFALQQSALKTGSLAPAMGASNAMTLIGSVILGSVVFGETLASGSRVVIAVIGLLIAIGGILALARDSRLPDTPSQTSPTADR
jgi:hypothetical protein